MKSLWVIRIFFLLMCTFAGYAVSQHRPEIIGGGIYGLIIGFGLGWLMIAIDVMLKGFSLRAFSAATFGLLLGTVVAAIIDRNELFVYGADEKTRWVVRLALFLSFGYVGMVLAMLMRNFTIELATDPPTLKDVVRRNVVRIAVRRVSGLRQPTLLVLAAIDNLVKGAAGQAIQNANVSLGLPEATGLPA